MKKGDRVKLVTPGLPDEWGYIVAAEFEEGMYLVRVDENHRLFKGDDLLREVHKDGIQKVGND